MSDSRKCYDLKHRENCCVREDAAKELMRTLDAGCSALVWGNGRWKPSVGQEF